jgi:signal transduction histidine kinase
MKKPWQIWSLFVLCLMAVAIAMSWLSLKAQRLESLREADQAETELARREAELQERVSSALYRLDLKMLPLIAQEAARPQYYYQSFYDVLPPPIQSEHSTGNEIVALSKLHLPSPLLFQSSESVLLHFEIDRNNEIKSPQFPESSDRQAATLIYHLSHTALEDTAVRMNKAKQLFDYQTLWQKTLPLDSDFQDNRNHSLTFTNSPGLAYNVPAVENFVNQTSSLQAATFDNVPSSKELPNRIDQQRSRGDQRVNSAFNQRRNSTQEMTQSNFFNSNGNMGVNALVPDMTATSTTIESLKLQPMQPIWLGDHLVMARRVSSGDPNPANQSKEDYVIQCCWLNWEKIDSDLRNECAELLPGVEFEALTPNTELKIGTALTTIPVQLIIDRPKMLSMLALDSPEPTKSALPISLFAAWCCLGLAAITSALLLQGVIRLSERRAAFVSAVTHELRTPLTTFRMYSEMLADGMVPTEKQQQYANTLKIQADRLTHLVENVLQFARLERGPTKNLHELCTVGALFDRFCLRLEERTLVSQMQLVIEVDDSASKIAFNTQPAAIEQILFNLVDNACKYAQGSSDNRIVISVRRTSDRIQFHVRDFGPGMLPMDRKRMFEPFQRSASATANAIPGVGLGLALCQRMARSLGGRLFNQPCANGALFVFEVPADR